MADKIWVSFKNNEKEQKILNWLNEKSEIIGSSSYIKQLLYEKMIQEKKVTEK